LFGEMLARAEAYLEPRLARIVERKRQRNLDFGQQLRDQSGTARAQLARAAPAVEAALRFR
jgi:hypothetical protein